MPFEPEETALPSSTLERAELMKDILTAAATGGTRDDPRYTPLRREFLNSPQHRDRLPPFLLRYRDLGAFWPFIRDEAPSYAERRRIISQGFNPLLDLLDGAEAQPADEAIAAALTTLGGDQVEQAWSKALRRRESDPEGALTLARTLLETVIKHILDQHSIDYGDKDDLPKLYGKAAEALNLAPSQHSEPAFKTILGSAMNLVNGLGTLRNRLSDSHGRSSRLPVRPAPRHASLAVNTAGAIAAFLVETHLHRAEEPAEGASAAE